MGIVLCPIVIPWPYVWANYGKKPGTSMAASCVTYKESGFQPIVPMRQPAVELHIPNPSGGTLATYVVTADNNGNFAGLPCLFSGEIVAGYKYA